MSTNNKPILNDTLFTDLTPERAETIGGGGFFRMNFGFDDLTSSSSFSVKPGGTVLMSSTTTTKPFQSFVTVSLWNLNSGRKSTKLLKAGVGGLSWTSVRGGSYVLQFSDRKDGVFSRADMQVSFTS